jgi:hypothetical protein
VGIGPRHKGAFRAPVRLPLPLHGLTALPGDRPGEDGPKRNKPRRNKPRRNKPRRNKPRRNKPRRNKRFLRRNGPGGAAGRAAYVP